MKKGLIFLFSVVVLLTISQLASAQCGCNFVIAAATWNFDGAALGVKPGDKICFANGVRKNIDIRNVNGTPDKPVIITNMCDGKVVVEGSATVVTPYGINVYTSSNFKFSGSGNPNIEYGIEITRTHMGLEMRGLSTDFEVDHVYIHDIGSVAFTGHTDPTCDPKTWYGNFTMRNVSYHHNMVNNSADEGMYVGNSHYTSGVTMTCNGVSTKIYEHEVIGVDIHDNIILNTGRDGIQVGSATSQCYIHDNRVENWATRNIYAHKSGIQINQGTVANIYRNKLLKGTGFGIFVSGSGGTKVINNIVTDAAEGGIFANDFAPFYPNSSYVFLNNTFINVKAYGIYMQSEGTVNNLFANNIIVAAPNQTGFQYVKLNNPSNNHWTERNNIKTTDLASVKFVNPAAGDYHLLSPSPAVNTGCNLVTYGVTDDFDHVARPSGAAFDIGTYEIATAGGAAPVANAGVDKTITLPTSTTSFTGSATDSDGTIATYAWTKKSGGQATLANANTSTLSVSGVVAGTYTFTLTVTDNSGMTASDDVVLVVKSANAVPTANAGADKTIQLPTTSTSFTGSGADSDGTISTYAWTKKSGGAATLTNASTSTLSVSGVVAGTYTFTLTVTDNSGATAVDDVVLLVKPANAVPTANAGADKTIQLPTSSASFTGSGTDSDGTISTYAWTKKSGGSATLTNASTSTLSVSGVVAGTYTFTLTVTDNSGATATDDVVLLVKPVNVAPVANAAGDKTIQLPVSSTSFTGTGTDSDGTISTYSWTKKSGGLATLANTGTSTLSVSGLEAGTYTFTLTVTDNSGSTGSDDVVLIVKPVNVAPTANAGTDKSATLPVSSVLLSGTGTDTDGTLTTYSWTKKSGGAATLTNANTSTLTVSDLVAGAYTFTLTVTDNSGATGSDDVDLIVIPANVTPIVNAGTDQTVTLPANAISLTGTSVDTDGSISTYSWEQVSGGASTLTSAATPVLNVTNLVRGVYTFRLTVTDNQGATAFDDVIVDVIYNPVGKFNFTNSAQNISGWTDVAGAPHAAVIVATDRSSNYSVSSVSTAQWNPANFGTLSTSYNGGAKNGTVQPTSVVETNWFNYNAAYGSTVNGVVQGDNIQLSNLDPTHVYTIQLGASRRNGGTADQYGTFEYRINGGDARNLLVTNNTTVQVEYASVAPDAQGRIGISARKISGSAMNFGYIGWLVVTDVTVSAHGSQTGRVAFSTSAESITEQEQSDEITESNTEESFVFLGKSYPAGFEYSLIVFNETGERVFQGKGTPELFSDILQPGTLYIYHVIQNGVKIDSGKTYRIN